MDTGFKGLHPTTAFLFFVLAFAATLCFSHPLLLFASFTCAFAYSIKLLKKAAVKSFFCFHFPMIFLVAAINFAFSHYGVTTLLQMQNGNRFTLEAIVYGFVFGVKASCLILWLSVFNEIIDGDKFIFLFGKLSPRTALVISMVLRFIPLFKEKSKEIEDARKGLGIDSKSGKITNRIKNSSHALSILITLILENAIDTADSMTARGYGAGRRKPYNNYTFSKTDAVFIALSALSAVLLIVFRGSFYAVYNPVIEVTAPDFLGIITLLLFILLGFLPLIYDIWEEKLWSM